MYLVFVPKMALFIKHLVLIHPNKMALPKENIDILDIVSTLMIHMSSEIFMV